MIRKEALLLRKDNGTGSSNRTTEQTRGVVMSSTLIHTHLKKPSSHWYSKPRGHLIPVPALSNDLVVLPWKAHCQ
ncbi:hypothetical protein F2P79_005630 [Pimephales promelas]|nr:hypothetical protein F2P79_005630 [Pimephales promelas]